MKKILILSVIVVLALAVVGYYFLGEKKEIEATPSGQVTRVAKVERGDLNLTVSANGVVQPIYRVEIKSKASGQIEQLNFVEGQYVTKGTLLIALDQQTTKNDYDQAKADLALYEAASVQADNNYKRALELFEKKLISEQERDQSNVEKVRAKSQLVKAQAALATAEERLRDTRIVAPISGIILTKNVEIGQIISSGVSNVGGGTVLASIADMEQVYVETNVDEVDIGNVLVGQRSRVVADAYPDDVFNGEVIRIAPLGKTQQNVTTFSVIILVRNLNNRLKAGMSTSVDIEVFRRPQVLLVPTEALNDPRSEQGKTLLASLKENEKEEDKGSVKPDSVRNGSSTAGGKEKSDVPFDFRAMREKTKNMSPEERRKFMQEQLAKLPPEQRERIMQMRQRFGGQGGGGGEGMAFGGDGGPQAKRQAQVGNQNETKQRVVMVKEGEQFVPKLIKVGASNFDYAEVLEGLTEGDEIQITNISRAKIAAEQLAERMRNQSMGGLSGNVRVPGGR